MNTNETNNVTNSAMNAATTSILHNLSFIESLVYFADAELVLNGIGPNAASYSQAEEERDSRIKAIAECVDAYCQRRIAQGVAQADQRRGEAAQ
jgi:hypothetical protein